VTMLSQVVHQPTKPGSIKERLQILTNEVSERYRATEVTCDPQVLKTFSIFRSLMTFFECYHESKHEEALEILNQTKLIPLSMNDLDVCVQNFKK
jgi:nuclear pore complex protein Nup93